MGPQEQPDEKPSLETALPGRKQGEADRTGGHPPGSSGSGGATRRLSLPGSVIRLVWFAAGWLALGLAAIGLVLPILPTTPFVILAAFFFAKCSPALADRLNRSRTFGPMIADWQANGAIAPRYKSMAIAMMAAAFSVSLALSLPPAVLVVQALCMGSAAMYILSRPSRGHAKGQGRLQPVVSRKHH